MDASKDISETLSNQLKGLIDEDISWMRKVGSRKKLTPGEVLIYEQQPIDALYIILSGVFEISTSEKLFSSADLSSEEIPLATVDSGLIGEMSFVRADAYLPAATVKANKESFVWFIPKYILREKINSDTAFGSRFHQVLGSILADRLDSTNRLLSANKKEEAIESSLWKALTKLFNRYRYSRESSELSPLTNVTPGMLLFMIDRSLT